MGLSEARQGIVDRLRLLPNIDQAPDYPTPNIVEEKTLFVYGIAGDTTMLAHAGKHGGAVARNDDRIIIEWHWRLDQDRLAEGVAAAEEMIGLIRTEVIRGYHVDRFGGSVIGIGTLSTTAYGDLGWGSEKTFGFRLTLDVVTGEEI